jgi:FtsP/CotA-like multicopper oxidase with cupredoxin domain
MIRVSLDNHMMQVMTSDFIPVVPYYTQTVLLAMGQRYDVVINANQTAGNYWFRANVATDCLSANAGAGRAIWTYSSVTAGTPTTNAWSQPSNCLEPSPLAPYWVQPVPSSGFASAVQSLTADTTRAKFLPNNDTVVVWALGNESVQVNWGQPTLNYLFEGNTSYPERYNILHTTNEGSWNYWVIQQGSNLGIIPHPIHLHGHDFFVLGFGSGTFNANTASLNYQTPPRRDTVILPANGWLAIAFDSNNPGIWLMHCHIAWHVSEGFGAQFLEAPDSITMPDQGAFDSTCKNFNSYAPGAYYKQDDSGL